MYWFLSTILFSHAAPDGFQPYLLFTFACTSHARSATYLFRLLVVSFIHYISMEPAEYKGTLNAEDMHTDLGVESCKTTLISNPATHPLGLRWQSKIKATKTKCINKSYEKMHRRVKDLTRQHECGSWFVHLLKTQALLYIYQLSCISTASGKRVSRQKHFLISP